jgi:hypothetical protein
MAGSPDVPVPEDILTLGSVSKVPEEDETTTAGIDFESGITDILGSTSSLVTSAVARTKCSKVSLWYEQSQ